MGSPLQEILQGRGDKKGQSFWIKRTVPLLFLVSTWFGLLIDFPVLKPVLWFSFSICVTLVYSFLHFYGKRKEFSVEFLFSAALLLYGLIFALKLFWLKLAYFPLIILLTAFYSPGTIIFISFLIPLLGIKNFNQIGDISGEAAFSVFLIATAVISSMVSNSLRKSKEKAITSLKSIKDKAMNMAHETTMDSIGSEKAMTHYFASMMKTDEEIKELLITIRQAVFADSASLFVPDSEGFTLRCSSDEKDGIIITGGGMVSACMAEKKVFYSGEVNDKRSKAGYTKDDKISSVIVVPVIDGSAVLGALSVDSTRY